MISLHSDHLKRKNLHNPFVSESDVFCPDGWVRTTFEPYHFANRQGTRAQYRPHLLLIKNGLVLNSLLDFLLESVIKVFVEEWYFVESWAESVLKLCIRSLEIKYMLVLLGKLLRKVYKGLLIGLLVGERVLLYEMKASVWVLSDDCTVWDLPNSRVIARGNVLTLVCLTHLN